MIKARLKKLASSPLSLGGVSHKLLESRFSFIRPSLPLKEAPTSSENSLSTPFFLRQFQVPVLPKAATATMAVARTSRLSISDDGSRALRGKSRGQKANKSGPQFMILLGAQADPECVRHIQLFREYKFQPPRRRYLLVEPVESPPAL